MDKGLPNFGGDHDGSVEIASGESPGPRLTWRWFCRFVRGMDDEIAALINDALDAWKLRDGR